MSFVKHVFSTWLFSVVVGPLFVFIYSDVAYSELSDIAEDMDKAASYKQQGNHYKAMFYYQSALAKDKNNTDALYELAFIDYKNKNIQLSLKRLNMVLYIDSYNVDALVLRGKTHAQLEQWGSAIADLEMAEQLDSENPDIQIELENIYSKTGEKNKAMQSISTYRRLTQPQNTNSSRQAQ